MIKKIEQLLKAQDLCEIFSNVEDTDKFAVGYFIGLDEKYFIAESIDQYGISDGIFCSLSQNIVKLQTDTKYLANINKLFIHNKQLRYPCLNYKENLLINFINMAYEKQKICTIELCDSNLDDIIGYIIDIDKNINTLEMQIINLNGEKDGKATVDIKMISRISCDSLEDKKIELLSKLGRGDGGSDPKC